MTTNLPSALYLDENSTPHGNLPVFMDIDFDYVLKTGVFAGRTTGSIFLERFDAKVDSCWLWNGSTRRRGYGRIKIRGRFYCAHRVSYLYYIGPFEQSLLVCHTCDNPGCVRPDHLFLGTNKENTRDKWSKNRANNPFGSRVKQARLTDDDIREIFELNNKGWTLTEIGKKFSYCPSNVLAILKRKKWRHVQI